MFHILQSALASVGRRLESNVRLDFSTAFNRINHRGIPYNHALFYGYWRFFVVYIDRVLLNGFQHVIVDSSTGKLVSLLVSSATGKCFGTVIVPPVHLSIFFILENKLIGYADNYTLIADVPSPGVRVRVAASLSRDLVKVSEWCVLWGMKLNASKTKTMIVSRSRTVHPMSPPVTLGGIALKESDNLGILGETFDSKMTFEKHLRSVSRAASQRLDI